MKKMLISLLVGISMVGLVGCSQEVKKGFECGITLEKFNDFKEGDTIEAYEMIEVKHA